MDRIGKKMASGTLLVGALLGSGCGSDNGQPFIPIALAPPVAINDTYQVLGNGVLQVSAPGVLANDNANTATPVLGTPPGKGTVTLNADGSFTYRPNTGQANTTDTFTYTLNNGFGASAATVTIQIGAAGFFVKNDAPAGGNGSQESPFRTLAEADTASNGVNGAVIVVFRGNGTSAGLNTPLTLETNQSLRGFDPAARPLLTGPVFLTQGNSLSDLSFQGSVPAVINATNAVGPGLVGNVNVTTTGNKALYLGNATGTWTIQNSAFADANFGALDGSADAGALNWSVLNCTFTNCFTSIAGNITNSATQTLTVRNNTFTNGRDEEVFVGGRSTATNFTVTMTDNTVNGGGTALRGLDVQTQNTCNVTVSCHNNTITGCTSNGILLDAQGVSTAAARFNANRLTGNNVGFPGSSYVAQKNGTAMMRLALDANTADTYGIGNGGGPVSTTIENLATLTSRNTGAFSTSGVVDGPCPAP